MLKKVSYKDIIRFTGYYYSHTKRGLAIVMVLLALAAFMDGILPYIMGQLVTSLNGIDVENRAVPKGVWILFGFLVAVDILYHSFRNGAYGIFNKFVAVPILGDITEDAYQKVQKFSSNWHMNNFAGATVRKITRGMWAFDTFEDILILYLFPTFVVMVSIIGIMIFTMPIMGVIMLGMISIYIAISLWTVLKINAPLFRKSAEKDTAIGAALADVVTGNPTVKSFGTEYREEENFGRVINGWRGAALHSWQVATWTDWFRRMIASVMFIISMGMAIYLFSIGKASTGDVVYIFSSVWVLFAYLRHIGEQTANLQRAMTEMEDVVHFWKTDIAIKDKKDAVKFIPKEGAITFDNITFAYNETTEPIYKDFSIDIKAGEKIALVGYSGSGKSTFVKLLQRLYDVQSGEVRLDGQNIAKVTQSSLRSGVALVPQDPILFHRTLRDNIAYAKPEATDEEIVAAAKKAFAHDFIKELPLGYQTLVGERGIKLSGGERQRVAIARAILSDTKILILDEATSSLDSVSEHYIQKALESLMEGRTAITIAHRLSTIKNVDRILVFDQGKIIEQGTHQELLANEQSHYKKLFDVQVLGLVE